MRQRTWTKLLVAATILAAIATIGLMAQAQAGSQTNIPAGAKLDTSSVAGDVATMLPDGKTTTINMDRDVYAEAHRQDAANPAPAGSAYEYRFNADGKLVRTALCSQRDPTAKETAIALQRGATEAKAHQPVAHCDPITK